MPKETQFTRRLDIAVSESLAERLKAAAAAKETSVAELIRRTLARSLAARDR